MSHTDMDHDDESAALTHSQDLFAEASGSLFTALAKARAEIRNPPLDKTNPHFKSKFASLGAVIDATVPVLARHGIAVVQDLRTLESAVECYTYLLHESGQSVKFGPFTVPATKLDAQGFASASTYARRYALMGVTVVVGDDDDDGNEASRSAFKAPATKTKAYNALKDGAANDDSLKVRETWDELTTEQQEEVWAMFGASESGIRSTLKRLLAQTKPEAA